MIPTTRSTRIRHPEPRPFEFGNRLRATHPEQYSRESESGRAHLAPRLRCRQASRVRTPKKIASSLHPQHRRRAGNRAFPVLSAYRTTSAQSNQLVPVIKNLIEGSGIEMPRVDSKHDSER